MSVIQVAFQRVREPQGPSGDDDESFSDGPHASHSLSGDLPQDISQR